MPDLQFHKKERTLSNPDIPGLPRIPAHLLREIKIQAQPKAFVPLHDVVMYRIVTGRTDSGIVLPEGKGYERRIVVAVGPGLEREDGTLKPMTVKVNDEVLPAPGARIAGADVFGINEPLYVTTERDIAAIIVPDESGAS